MMLRSITQLSATHGGGHGQAPTKPRSLVGIVRELEALVGLSPDSNALGQRFRE